MAGDTSEEATRQLDQTPTWAVAGVCAVIIIVSIALEKVLHKLGKGKVPIITVDGLHQLHILIFFLAVLHVAYSAITMALGRLKGCFFRQFYASVSRSDYLTLRNGFINLHLAPGRWQAMMWASIIPLIVILAVGTKLQAILTKMALEITERHAVIQGIPLVQASDKHFWFSKPQLMLHLIHFALFQNAFQITYFFWIWYEYKINSCFHDNMRLVIMKLVIGVGVLILCSYITLPLYALLSQMGSNMKMSIFDEQTSKALKKWRMAVKRKHGGKGGKSRTPSMFGDSASPSPIHPAASGLHQTAAATLHRFKTTGHSTRNFTYEETDVSDLEAEPLSPESSTRHLIDMRGGHHSDNEIELDRSDEQEEEREDEFSFAKPKPAPPLL
ncbi:Mlo-related protein [Cynara cardunculus var. scolymus]|uniref:Mlo-related protein n=1 Tax=Cynara cardunculus var. scolymus TaxID=59895 RepID=A0A103XJZ1_CYNCS|nr:Mlo-related protein [Cynara cardunculus var. scolymus]